MSYILDALKRAEAERSRGGVPTLHSQAVPVTAAARSPLPALTWIAVIAVAALAAGAALWWTLGRQAAPSPAPAAVELAPAQTAAPVAAPAPAPALAVAPPIDTAPARPAKPDTPRKTTEPPRAIAARQPASVAVAASSAASAPVATAPAASTATRATPAPAPIAAPQEPIYTLAELPPDIRVQLPALTISGATYSGQAAYRMLIANGQVLHENDSPAPGLTLESIRQKDVVLRFKGYRYSVGY